MISFPKFGQYTSQSYTNHQSPPTSSTRRLTSSSLSTTSTTSSSSPSFKPTKLRKLKKLILMALLYYNNTDSFSRNFDLPFTNVYEFSHFYKLIIPWDQLLPIDPNYDLGPANFPNEKYISKYFEKLGLDIKGQDIHRPYEFGYFKLMIPSDCHNYNLSIKNYSKKDRRRNSLQLKYQEDHDYSDESGLVILDDNCFNCEPQLKSPLRKATPTFNPKLKLKYGAKCGYCSKFVPLVNESAEGGFLSYLDYFRHWMLDHFHVDTL